MFYYRLTYDKIHRLHDTRIWLTKYHTYMYLLTHYTKNCVMNTCMGMMSKQVQVWSKTTIFVLIFFYSSVITFSMRVKWFLSYLSYYMHPCLTASFTALIMNGMRDYSLNKYGRRGGGGEVKAYMSEGLYDRFDYAPSVNI